MPENNKISEGMMELNEKLDALMGKLVGSLVSETGLSAMPVDPALLSAMEGYKLMFEYMKLFTEYVGKQEDLMTKMDKALDIYIRKAEG